MHVKMIKHCVCAVFCRSPKWLQVIRSSHFCVPVQTKPYVSMCSLILLGASMGHSQPGSLFSCPRDCSKIRSLQRSVQTQIIPVARSCLMQPAWHTHTAQCTTLRAPAWGITYTSELEPCVCKGQLLLMAMSSRLTNFSVVLHWVRSEMKAI